LVLENLALRHQLTVLRRSARRVHACGPEGGRPRAQKNERRQAVRLAMAELLDGAPHQRERLVGMAGETICNAEGRGGERCSEDELPHSAEVEVPLEDASRAWESSESTPAR
jgi:hypothetical protein